MRSKNYSYFFPHKNIILLTSNLNTTKIFILALSLFSFSFILDSIQSFNNANAVDSLTKSIQQFNNKIQSDVDKQIQSNLNQGIQQPSTNDNINDCSDNDNFVNQFHTSDNGQPIKSINNPSCNVSTSVLSSLDSQR
jgi:hypothetical protein